VHVATIESHGQRQVWPRQLIPVQLAALGEHRLLWAEFRLAATSDSERGPSDGRHIDVLVDGQESMGAAAWLAVERSWRRSRAGRRDRALLHVLFYSGIRTVRLLARALGVQVADLWRPLL
jgi:hypothetical protein